MKNWTIFDPVVNSFTSSMNLSGTNVI